MFNFESGRYVNREVESALQEVQDVLNLVDVLARATGNFLNSVGSENDRCFSDNVSQWLFDKRQGSSFAATRRRERELRAAQIYQSYPNLTAGRSGIEDSFELESTRGNRSTIDLGLLGRREEAESRARHGSSFSSRGSYADGQNISSSYYSSQLLSHSVSSNNNYVSPKSRYLENQAAQVSRMRDRLSAISTTSTPRKSACELVGPIAPLSTTSCQKKSTCGVTVSLTGGGGGYSEIRSVIAKSKGMFQDFASPSNPNYTAPWERSREGRTRLLRNYYR